VQKSLRDFFIEYYGFYPSFNNETIRGMIKGFIRDGESAQEILDEIVNIMVDYDKKVNGQRLHDF
jgi:hypothetical protein